jgi:hypothetical protein
LAFHSGREADHSSPSSAEVKEWVELYLQSPNTPSWRDAQLGGAQWQLYYFYYHAIKYILMRLVHYVTIKKWNLYRYIRYGTKRPWGQVKFSYWFLSNQLSRAHTCRNSY